MLNGLKATLKRSYHSWTESRRERKRMELGESGLNEFAEYIQEHEAEALKKRKEERMKKRESKLNQIKSDLECHKERPPSSRKHLHMRNAKSVRYKPDNQPVQNGTNSRKLVLPEPLEIFVDGPFGSPSSNIYRAEHAVLIGTGIGESLSLSKPQPVLSFLYLKESHPSPPSCSPSCTGTGPVRPSVPSAVTPGPVRK